jgi:hypothetical protein
MTLLQDVTIFLLAVVFVCAFSAVLTHEISMAKEKRLARKKSAKHIEKKYVILHSNI